VSENLDFIQKQADKYLKANAIKKKAIESKVRHKLKGVQYSISFQIRLIDAVYVRPPAQFMPNGTFSDLHGQPNM
jgi:hypothetical protein